VTFAALVSNNSNHRDFRRRSAANGRFDGRTPERDKRGLKPWRAVDNDTFRSLQAAGIERDTSKGSLTIKLKPAGWDAKFLRHILNGLAAE
jgi:hypothetical protein